MWIRRAIGEGTVPGYYEDLDASPMAIKHGGAARVPEPISRMAVVARVDRQGAHVALALAAEGALHDAAAREPEVTRRLRALRVDFQGAPVALDLGVGGALHDALA